MPQALVSPPSGLQHGDPFIVIVYDSTPGEDVAYSIEGGSLSVPSQIATGTLDGNGNGNSGIVVADSAWGAGNFTVSVIGDSADVETPVFAIAALAAQASMSLFEEAQKLSLAANLSGAGIASMEEAVTLTKKVGGATRSIYAAINRQPPRQVAPDGRVTTPKMTALVRNSTTTGYASTEFDARDTITVAYRPGGTPTAYTIRLSDEQGSVGPGFLILELN